MGLGMGLGDWGLGFSFRGFDNTAHNGRQNSQARMTLPLNEDHASNTIPTTQKGNLQHCHKKIKGSDRGKGFDVEEGDRGGMGHSRKLCM